MESITISIPKDCLTYISEGGVPSATLLLQGRRAPPSANADDGIKYSRYAGSRRRPNNWQWNNRKEYQAWWYQQNREIYKAKVLQRYHEKKMSDSQCSHPEGGGRSVQHYKIGFK